MGGGRLSGFVFENGVSRRCVIYTTEKQNKFVEKGGGGEKENNIKKAEGESHEKEGGREGERMRESKRKEKK